MTRKPSSGGGHSLRGALAGEAKDKLRFRSFVLVHVGEQLVCFRPFVVSASFSCWLFLWESRKAEAGEGSSRLTFFEDLWNSRAWDGAGPLFLCTGGNPRVELYKLVMLFLLGQELSAHVWDFLLRGFPELSHGWFSAEAPAWAQRQTGLSGPQGA